MDSFSQFIEDCKFLHFDPTMEQLDQLLDFFELMTDYNKKVNLTTITDFEEVCKLHFLDSLIPFVLPEDIFPFPRLSCEKMIDVGTGAGFPGIPLKIFFPDIRLTLMDSLKKRLTFLDEVILSLSLNRKGEIQTLHGRAEELSTPAKKLRQAVPIYRESFDFVVSRAVANLSTLSEYCIPFVKVNGFFLSYKAGHVEDEVQQAVRAISLLGGEIIQVYPYTLPNSEIQRSIILIQKKRSTPSEYPRKPGLPSKKPLR